VILRQLLSPNPSASANEIDLLPHHDGRAPATGVADAEPLEEPDAFAALDELDELEPHAASATATPIAPSPDKSLITFLCINFSTLSFGSLL
jgi:hypothetical protein